MSTVCQVVNMSIFGLRSKNLPVSRLLRVHVLGEIGQSLFDVLLHLQKVEGMAERQQLNPPVFGVMYP